jgi:redox-sensitive bicupin YhaK (pirin superfamily)
VTIHADGSIYAALLDAAEAAQFKPAPGRRANVRMCECANVQVARGALTVNGEKLDAGDAAMIVDAGKVTLEQVADAEVLLFDLGESNS